MPGKPTTNLLGFQKRWRRQSPSGGKASAEGVVGLESWPGCAFNSFGFSPFPTPSSVAWCSRHPEAGEWAAQERPQGMSTACAVSTPAFAPSQRPHAPSSCPLHVGTRCAHLCFLTSRFVCLLLSPLTASSSFVLGLLRLL